MEGFDVETQEHLRATLEEISRLEGRYAPFGVSFTIRGDAPTATSPPDPVPLVEAADYVLAVIHRTKEILRDLDSIPVI